MFKQIKELNEENVSFYFEGQKLVGLSGDTVAAALLRANIIWFRIAPQKGNPNATRGPFCMMGTCFECLVEIDGRPNQQACQIILQANMRVRYQNTQYKSHNNKEKFI